MKRWLWFVTLALAAGALDAQARWGWGVEAEGRWSQGIFESAGVRLSSSAEWKLADPLWMGLRASLGVWGPGGLWYVVPRANLSVGWDLAPGLILELEAPYSPGVGLVWAGRWYLEVGTDELLVTREFVVRTLTLEVRTPF